MPPLSSKLDRKLRAAEESSDDSENYEVTDRSSSESVLEFEGGDVVGSESEAGAADGSEDEETVSIIMGILYISVLTQRSQISPKTTKYKHK